MKPRFVIISGPREGETVTLDRLRDDDPPWVLGRHADCTLQLPDLNVSRRHCALTSDGPGRFRLRDLDSLHGTFVNTQPITRRMLRHSDLIQLGATTLLFLLDDAVDVDPRGVDGDDDEAPLAHSTLRAAPREAFYLQPAAVREALADDASADGARPPRHIARDLGTLLELATVAQQATDADALCARAIALLLRALPAARGAAVLRDADADRLVIDQRAVTRMDRVADPSPSRTALNQVFAEQVALCCADVAAPVGNAALAEAPSLRAAPVRSLVCAPLPGPDGPLGALYFDSPRADAFGRRHLELLTAAAGISALALRTLASIGHLRAENRRLQGEQAAHGMIGESAAMQKVYQLIERVAAAADTTVLIRGESGTGKELAARAIHRASPRADAAFVAINCATLSDTLLESELFGHEKGAFTGAVARKIGRFELAAGGTVFLDEIGEMTPRLQAKLLRVLQERTFERVGGTRTIRADVRVIAATHRDLETAIGDGHFRDDLYYRLAVVTLTMPPLRTRRDDIPLLARHFARLHGQRLRRPIAGLSAATRAVLLAYDWPGNVRQLGNAIERAVVLGADDHIHPEDLPDEVLEAEHGPEPSTFQAAITATKKRLIVDAYARAEGDHQIAAAALDLHPNSLHRLIRTLGLKDQLTG